MKLTKLEHSGLILEKDGKKLVFDPVEITEKLPEMKNVAAIILTHKHPDHVQLDKLQTILAENPATKVIGPSDLTVELPQFVTAKAGDKLSLSGFDLEFFGHDHGAVCGIVPCENLGVVIDHRIVNAGDSFDRPELNLAVDVLFVPEIAPWWNVDGCTDFITDIKPKIAIPVHDALLSSFGKQVFGGGLQSTCEKVGTKWLDLKPGESIEI